MGVVESDILTAGDEPPSDEVGASAVVDADSAVGVAGVIDLRPRAGQLDVLSTTDLGGMGVISLHATINGPDHYRLAGTDEFRREYTFAPSIRRGPELASPVARWRPPLNAISHRLPGAR